MKVFLDTSILIAAVLEQHQDHARAFPVLQRVQSGTDEGYVSHHSLAEMYAVLTKLPVPFRHTPEQALLSIEENVLQYFKISDLTGQDYGALLREAALAAIQGGAIYDAVLLKSATKAKVKRIYTFNLRHFQAIASSDIRSSIAVP